MKFDDVPNPTYPSRYDVDVAEISPSARAWETVTHQLPLAGAVVGSVARELTRQRLQQPQLQVQRRVERLASRYMHACRPKLVDVVTVARASKHLGVGEAAADGAHRLDRLLAVVDRDKIWKKEWGALYRWEDEPEAKEGGEA